MAQPSGSHMAVGVTARSLASHSSPGHCFPHLSSVGVGLVWGWQIGSLLVCQLRLTGSARLRLCKVKKSEDTLGQAGRAL